MGRWNGTGSRFKRCVILLLRLTLACADTGPADLAPCLDILSLFMLLSHTVACAILECVVRAYNITYVPPPYIALNHLNIKIQKTDALELELMRVYDRS